MDTKNHFKFLYGSNILPSVSNIRGTPVQLGTIVQRAFDKSGKTIDDWNLLPDNTREALLQAELDVIHGEIK